MDTEVRSITIHTEADFEGMRKAGRLAAETLDYISSFVEPGIPTGNLDELCEPVSDLCC